MVSSRPGSRISIPGDDTGFLGLNKSSIDTGQEHSPDYQATGVLPLDEALDSNRAQARALADAIKARADEVSAGLDPLQHPTSYTEAQCFPTALKNCIFVGHTMTDLDSVASAIAAAELFEGVACCSEKEVNGEISFACDFAGFKQLPFIEDKIEDTCAGKVRGIVLVDHNEPGQSPACIGKVAFPSDPASVDPKTTKTMRSRICGVIDHHALSANFETAGPCFIDIRPWGSACSIVAHYYVRLGKPMPTEVAKVLLCGILSDTINLTSPTVTDADKLMATMLCFLGKVNHPNVLAQDMFRAKTKWFVSLGAYEMIRGDQKSFKAGGLTFGWATIEVTSVDEVMKSAGDLLLELRVLKKDKDYDFVFLSVVDITKMNTWLLLCGHKEVALAREAFKIDTTTAACSADQFSELHASIKLKIDDTLMDIGNLTSRKTQFVPPVMDVLSQGWKPTEAVTKAAEGEEAPCVKEDSAPCVNQCCSFDRVLVDNTGTSERVSRGKIGVCGKIAPSGGARGP